MATDDAVRGGDLDGRRQGGQRMLPARGRGHRDPSLLEDPDRIGPRHGTRVGRRTGIAANRLRRERPGPRESGEARLDAPARGADHRLAEVS